MLALTVLVAVGLLAFVRLGAAVRGSGTVQDPAGLQRALASARPGQAISLAGGLYGALELGPANLRGPVIIQSANPADPAIFTSVVVRGAKGVTLRDIQVVAPGHDPARPYLVNITNSSGVDIDGLHVRGAGGTVRLREYALWLRNIEGAQVRDSRFGGTRYGLGLLNNRKVAITGNEFSDLQTDGIRGGGVDDLLIKGNVLTGFSPKPGEHPDGIQLWSTNQKVAARRITISDNLVARGRGSMTQGIFVRDTMGQLPFEDLVIEGNLMIGTMYNGIAVLGVRRGRIANNRVLALPDQKSWIRIDNALNVDVSGNQAPQFLADSKAFVPPGNTVTPASGAGEPDAIRAWLAARPWLRSAAGPELTRLIGR